MPSGNNTYAKPMKVGLLAPYPVYPATSGGKKFIAHFHEYLWEQAPVEFIGVKENEIPSFAAEHFHTILGSSFLRYANLFLYFRVKKLIKKTGITVLVINHPYFGWLGVLLKKFAGIKIVLQSHNIEAERFKTLKKNWWKVLRSYEKHIHRQMDHNFFITDEDKFYAIENYELNPEKCSTITYGTELSAAPGTDEKTTAAETLRKLYGIKSSEKIFLFNGSLSYQPNFEAVAFIVNEIEPNLRNVENLNYKIIICGKGLPDIFIQNTKNDHIIFTGFVDDISLYFKGADIFLNAVVTGGGIKTKLVEALAYDLSAVSTISGAIGIDAAMTGNKLLQVKDGDWTAFAQATALMDSSKNIPATFYENFYWKNIVAKAVNVFENL